VFAFLPILLNFRNIVPDNPPAQHVMTEYVIIEWVKMQTHESGKIIFNETYFIVSDLEKDIE